MVISTPDFSNHKGGPVLSMAMVRRLCLIWLSKLQSAGPPRPGSPAAQRRWGGRGQPAWGAERG